jgi:hypothetical protein
MKFQGNFAWSEIIATEMIPVMRSINSIFILSVWTVAVLLLYAEFRWILEGNPDSGVLESFSDSLHFHFAGDTENSPNPKTQTVLVWFFSLWILNIFIGVICLGYEDEKAIAKQTLTQKRSQCAFRYLLRASRLPSNVFPVIRSKGHSLFCAVAISLCLAVQALPLFLSKLPWTLNIPIFVTLMLCISLAPFQTGFCVPWSSLTQPAGLHYLWFVVAREREEEESGAYTEMKSETGEDDISPRNVAKAVSAALRAMKREASDSKAKPRRGFPFSRKVPQTEQKRERME